MHACPFLIVLQQSFKKSRSQGKELKKELDRKTDEVQHLVEVQNEVMTGIVGVIVVKHLEWCS